MLLKYCNSLLLLRYWTSLHIVHVYRLLQKLLYITKVAVFYPFPAGPYTIVARYVAPLCFRLWSVCRVSQNGAAATSRTATRTNAPALILLPGELGLDVTSRLTVSKKPQLSLTCLPTLVRTYSPEEATQL